MPLQNLAGNALKYTDHGSVNVHASGDLPSVLRALKEPVPNCRFLSKPVDTKALMEAITELSAAATKR